MHTSVLRCTNWCYTHSYVTHGLLCINWMRKQLPVNTIPSGKCSSSHQYGQAAKCYSKVIDVLQSEKRLSFNDKEKFTSHKSKFMPKKQPFSASRQPLVVPQKFQPTHSAIQTGTSRYIHTYRHIFMLAFYRYSSVWCLFGEICRDF